MQIVVMPRFQAEQFECDEPWAAISVTDPGGPVAKLSTENRVALLQLSFYDTNHATDNAFSLDQAKQILAFAKDVVPKIEVLLVHCVMGVSRSPAIAAAVYKLLTDGDDSYYFKAYTPNTRVYNGLLRVAHHLNIKPGELLANSNPSVNT